MSTITLYIGNTMVAEINGLKNAITDAWVNNATVTFELFQGGVAVAGETWPVTLAYVAASNGDYRGLLSAALVLDRCTDYTATVKADDGAGSIGQWNPEVIVRER